MCLLKTGDDVEFDNPIAKPAADDFITAIREVTSDIKLYGVMTFLGYLSLEVLDVWVNSFKNVYLFGWFFRKF